IRGKLVTGVQTCALPIYLRHVAAAHDDRGRSEHLMAQRDIGKEGVGIGLEHRADRLVDAFAHLAARDRAHRGVAGERIDALFEEIGRASCRESGYTRYTE